MSDIFSNLGDVLSQQFNLGENKLQSLDIVKDGKVVPYGKLGDFANQFDQSAERSYTEEGLYRTDLFNPRAKLLEQYSQQPDITILVKKRAFSSLADNYRVDLLDKNEQIFIRATKILFQNKCNQISAYEKLTKISDIAVATGNVDSYLFPILFGATDTLSSVFSAFGGSSAFSSFKNTIDQVRTMINLSQNNVYTTWTTNTSNSFRTGLGEGTGVIEFTTALDVSTTTSINFGGGNFYITFADPYNLMKVTHNDIEQAIADATNVITGSSIFQIGQIALNDTLDSDKKLLSNMRASRGANPINFIINPDTFLGKRIRAIVDNSGIEIKFEGSLFQVDVDPGYLYPGGTLADIDGLSQQELSIFNRIIKVSFNLLQINQNSKVTTKSHNASTNRLRKKLRLHYGGKSIVQPMDLVNIFITSKTQVDEKILGGLQDNLSTLGLMQNINKSLNSIQDFLNAGKNDSTEKAIFVGKDFPNWLWLLLRNQFTTDKSGTHVFAGIVQKANPRFDSGRGTRTLSINGEDNTAYFGFGNINYRPANDVKNGALFDPITPFDIKFDSVTGVPKDIVPKLLPENQELFKSIFVKYKSGIYVGKQPTLNNFIQDTERVQNTSIRRVFYDPDGMVYKWKEGIGTLVLFGNNYQDSQTTNVATPPLTTDPFAGQDIMNVLSLLITGEPYNFATFYKAASSLDSFGRDLSTGADPSASYFKNLQNDIKKRNLLYGNFVPFKKLTVDEDSYKTTLNHQIRASGLDDDLNALLAKRADLNDQLTKLTNGGSNPSAPDVNNIKAQVDEVENSIAEKQQAVATELQKINQPISVIGNDTSLDSDPSLPANASKNDISNINKSNRDLRKKLHFLTRRLSWKVRANQDVNLFIVDDSYDKDYDIQAFEKAFSDTSLMKSEFSTVKEQIERVKNLFDLEVFADTQGHIQVRSPQYNKVPSSVFYRMIRLKQEFDIQLYPQFLEDLYVSQIDSALQRIEILEDEIRMFGIALGLQSDDAIMAYLASPGTSTSGVQFQFISNEYNGSASRSLLSDVFQNSNSQLFGSSAGLDYFKSVETQSQISDILSVRTRAALIQKTTASLKSKSLNNLIATSTRQDYVNNRLIAKTGQPFDLSQLFPQSKKLLSNKFISEADLFKIINEITDRISERQKLVKNAARSLKNAKEGLSLIKNDNNTVNKLLSPGLLDKTSEYTPFEGIVYDESYDDYGPGSGKRYIIKDQFIKNISIEEGPPPFTSVEVQGSFGGDNYNYNLPSDLNAFTQGGNALTSVTAVDYDMWRMYGVRLPEAIRVPFLSDPESQCAPFAVAMLNKARKQIQRGDITIFGNEYMQPGEVVYLESEDTLYYVESVTHSFSYNGSFNTRLNVAFGHMPGEYIPTYLDVVGKVLYKNREISNLVSVRDGSTNNEEHIGCIIGNTSNNAVSDSVTNNSIVNGNFANENRQVLASILETAENVFSTSDANYKPILELRVYYAHSTNLSFPSPAALKIANSIKDFLLGKNNLSELAKTKQPDSFIQQYKDQIRVLGIDSNNPVEFRAPSTLAYSYARRSLGQKQSRGSTDSTLIDGVIYNQIVDCWIHFDKN